MLSRDNSAERCVAVAGIISTTALDFSYGIKDDMANLSSALMRNAAMHSAQIHSTHTNGYLNYV